MHDAAAIVATQFISRHSKKSNILRKKLARRGQKDREAAAEQKAQGAQRQEMPPVREQRREETHILIVRGIMSHRSKPQYNWLDRCTLKERIEPTGQLRPVVMRHHRIQMMLEVIQMLQRDDRRDLATKQTRLRQGVPARGIVRNIRSDERNDPASHDHQCRIHRKNRRQSNDCKARDQHAATSVVSKITMARPRCGRATAHNMMRG